MKWAWLGLLAGLFALYLFSVLQSVLRPAWIAHGVAIGLVVAAAAAVRSLQRTRPDGRAGIASLRDFIAGIACVCVLGLLLSAASLWSVTKRARDVAGDAPFCIQVADNRIASYQPAGALLDLSGLTLFSHARILHHAILVVRDDGGARFFHWSYRRQNFMPGALNWSAGEYEPAVTCIPRRDFVDGLPVLFPEASSERYVRFSRQDAFRIPDVYQPRWSGGPSRTLQLATTAPDFAPLSVSWDAVPPDARDSSWVFVEWNPAWLARLMASTDGQILAQGVEFGLQKTSILWRGRDGKDYASDRYVANAVGAATDVNTTLIHCHPASGQFPKSCQHRFLNAGRHYYFRHRPEDVPRWQDMQKKLLDLFSSFEAHATDAHASR